MGAGLLTPCRWLRLYAALDLRLSASSSPNTLAVLPAGAFLLPADAARAPVGGCSDQHHFLSLWEWVDHAVGPFITVQY